MLMTDLTNIMSILCTNANMNADEIQSLQGQTHGEYLFKLDNSSDTAM